MSGGKLLISLSLSGFLIICSSLGTRQERPKRREKQFCLAKFFFFSVFLFLCLLLTEPQFRMVSQCRESDRATAERKVKDHENKKRNQEIQQMDYQASDHKTDVNQARDQRNHRIPYAPVLTGAFIERILKNERLHNYQNMGC